MLKNCDNSGSDNPDSSELDFKKQYNLEEILQILENYVDETPHHPVVIMNKIEIYSKEEKISVGDLLKFSMPLIIFVILLTVFGLVKSGLMTLEEAHKVVKELLESV